MLNYPNFSTPSLFTFSLLPFSKIFPSNCSKLILKIFFLHCRSEGDKFLDEKIEATENHAKKESRWSDLLNKTACALFGMGWLPIQFVFSQLPFIIHTAPESWSLPSYVTLTMSFGNMLSLILYFNKRRLLSHATPIIFAIYSVYVASLIGLAFTYHIAVPINGHPRSLFFYMFIFFLACSSCMYNLLSLPYMSRLKKEYLVAFFIGQGIDSSLPGLLGLFQVVTSHSKCSHPTEMVLSSKYFLLIGSFFVSITALSFFHLSKQVEPWTPKDESKSAEEMKTNSRRPYFNLILALRALFSFFDYGLLPGMQSFSCLPYLRGELVYQVVVTTNQFVGGIVVYLVSFTNLKSTKRLLLLSALQFCVNSYEATTAFMSPHPPMANTIKGSIHIVSIKYIICINV